MGKAGPSTRAALGIGTAGSTPYTTYKRAVTAALRYLQKGTKDLLPKDVLKALFAFRSITKSNKNISWKLVQLQMPGTLTRPKPGQSIAELMLTNNRTRRTHKLAVCFTKAKPIEWCGIWFYD